MEGFILFIVLSKEQLFPKVHSSQVERSRRPVATIHPSDQCPPPPPGDLPKGADARPGLPTPEGALGSPGERSRRAPPRHSAYWLGGACAACPARCDRSRAQGQDALAPRTHSLVLRVDAALASSQQRGLALVVDALVN